MEHLRLNPQSRIFALDQGHIGWMGWDAGTEAAVATYNLIASIVASFTGKEIPVDALYPLPGESRIRKPDDEPAAPTIAEFSLGAFHKFMYG